MRGREFLNLFLVFAATNGWWSFATWPHLGVSSTSISPLIIIGIIPTIVIIARIVIWTINDYYD